MALKRTRPLAYIADVGGSDLPDAATVENGALGITYDSFVQNFVNP